MTPKTASPRVPFPFASLPLVALALVGLAFTSAGRASTAASGTAPSSNPAGHPSAQGMPPGHPPAGGAAAAAAGVTGSVLETMDAGGYTYMRLRTATGETWAAVKQARVTVGSTVTVVNSMPMDGFESKTLNRKFDRILFGALAEPAAQGSGDAALRASMAAQHAVAATGAEAEGKISVAKAEGPEGRTVAEVFAQRSALKGKTVAVRGRVVKFSAAIMGKNWIHLRDGSGTPEGKDNDLTVTTEATVSTGEIVLVKGPLSVDRDFGGGYTYKVVVEGAAVAR